MQTGGMRIPPRPLPRFGRALLATFVAALGGAASGGFGLILAVTLKDGPRSFLEQPAQLIALPLTWMLSLPLALLLGSIPAFIAVLFLGWPILIWLNQFGAAHPLKVMAAATVVGALPGALALAFGGGFGAMTVALTGGFGAAAAGAVLSLMAFVSSPPLDSPAFED